MIRDETLFYCYMVISVIYIVTLHFFPFVDKAVPLTISLIITGSWLAGTATICLEMEKEALQSGGKRG